MAMPSGMWNFGYPTRDRTCAASVEAERPNHWISREIPNTWRVFSLLVYLINLFSNEGYLLYRMCWFLPNISMNQP